MQKLHSKGNLLSSAEAIKFIVSVVCVYFVNLRSLLCLDTPQGENKNGQNFGNKGGMNVSVCIMRGFGVCCRVRLLSTYPVELFLGLCNLSTLPLRVRGAFAIQGVLREVQLSVQA